MTNVCEERELQISMLLSGNLTADTELELRAHVDCCPACRDDLRALQEDHLRLSELPETMQPAIGND